MTTPSWQWDETIQRGTDYASAVEVGAYDKRMAALRDAAEEADEILALLDLRPDGVLLEVGSGTGALARAAAKRCHKVIALDVSPAMLDYAAERSQEEGISNISFKNAGFLSYKHQEEPVAAVVSQLALHHLPDAWKLVALKRLHGFLREGGKLYLADVVFPDEAEDDFCGHFERLVDSMPHSSRDEMARHIRQEFSTFDWVMRGMLGRAGFLLERAEFEGLFLARYLCRKE